MMVANFSGWSVEQADQQFRICRSFAQFAALTRTDQPKLTRDEVDRLIGALLQDIVGLRNPNVFEAACAAEWFVTLQATTFA